MSYKRVVRKGGKEYSYYYHSYREGDKVRKVYIGDENDYNRWIKKNSNLKSKNAEDKCRTTKVKKMFWILPLIALAIIFIFLFLPGNFTGKVSIDLKESYISSENLSGNLLLTLRQGELIPGNSKLVFEQSGEVSEFPISDIFSENLSGNFYLEGFNISGSGQGYGIPGIKTVYPDVHFTLLLSSENVSVISNESGGGSEQPEEIGNETAVLAQNETQNNQLPENITEIPSENVTENTAEIPSENTTEQPAETSSETSTETSAETPAETPQEVPATEITPTPAEQTEAPAETPLTPTPVESPSAPAQAPAPIESSPAPVTGEVVSVQGEGFFSWLYSLFSGKVTGKVVLDDAYEVSGIASKNKIFEYNLNGNNFYVKDGSVYSDYENLSSSVLSFAESDGLLSVSTDYSYSISGFGADYLGERKELKINLDNLRIGAKNGTLSVKLVFENLTLSEVSREIGITNEVNETETNETIKNATLNITTKQFKAVIGRPVKWLKKINAANLDSLLVELPKEAENVSIKTGSEIDGAERQIEQEFNADDKSSLITGNAVREEPARGFFSRLTGKATESIGNDNKNIIETANSVVVNLTEAADQSSEIAIEYATPAPEAVEENLTNGKRIIISADDELNYTDILAYTLLDNKISINETEKIKLYWHASYEDAVRYGYIQVNESKEIINSEQNSNSINNLEQNNNSLVNSTEQSSNEQNSSALNVIEPSSSEAIGIEQSNSVAADNLNSVLTGNVVSDLESEIENATNMSVIVEVSFDSYDLDEDGNVDYIEWIVPHLSSQVYDLRDVYIGPLLSNITSEGGLSNFTHLTINDTSLVGYWSFDADAVNTATTTHYDLSGNNYDGTGVGNVVANSSSGKYGNGAYLDGSGDYVTVGTVASLNFNGSTPYTISVWARRTSTSTAQIVGRNTGCTSSGWSFGFNYGGTGKLYFGTCAWISTTTNSVTGTGWNHLVLTSNGSNTNAAHKIYVNGTEVAVSDGGYQSYVSATAAKVVIGTYGEGVNYPLNGYIDELVIYNRALNSTEVLALFNNQSGRFFKTGTQELASFSVNVSDNRVNVTANFSVIQSTNLSASICYWNSTLGYNNSDFDGLGGLVSYYHLDDNANGWLPVATGILSYDTGIGSDLNRDFVYWQGTNFSFQVSLPVIDTYNFTIYIGDTRGAQSNNMIAIDGVAYYPDIDPPTGVLPYNVSLRVSKGYANITLGAWGGGWAVPVGFDVQYSNGSYAYKYDFGTSTSNVATGYTRITENSLSTITKAEDATGRNNGTRFYSSNTQAGVYGLAEKFQGSYSYINLPNEASFDFGNMSVSAWVNLNALPASAGNGYALVAKGYDSSVAFTLWYQNNWIDAGKQGFSFGKWSGSWILASQNSAASVRTWYHVVGTYNGTYNLYVNGAKIASSSATGVTNNNVNATIGAYIELGAPAYYANASIDEVAIFNRSLTDNEIKELYVKSRAKYSCSNEVNMTAGNTVVSMPTGSERIYPNFRFQSDAYGFYTPYLIGGVNLTTWWTNDSAPAGDTIYPTFSNYWNTTGTYPSQLAYFNVTIANTNGTVILYYDGGSVQASNITNVFNATVNFTTVGTRNYNWTGWGNGTSMNKNWSNNLAYTVLSDSQPAVSFISPTPNNASNQFNTDIYVNVSSSDDGGEHYTALDFDRSNVLWMRMDDVNSSGDPFDLSSWSNNGTRVNAVINSSSGKFGNGSWFDGNGDYINLGTGLNLGSTFTYSSWMYFKTNSAWYRLGGINKNGVGAESYASGTGPSSTFYFALYDTSWGEYNSLVTPSTGVWYHVTWVRNSSNNLMFYLNGTLNQTFSSAKTPRATAGSVYLGAAVHDPVTYDLDGRVDEVMIFNRSLTSAEILSLYNASANKYYNNFTGLALGNHTFTAYSVDTSGNKNQTSRTVTILGADTTPPAISFISPTPNNASSQTNTDIYVNVSSSDANDHYTFANFDKSLGLWYRAEGNANEEFGILNGTLTGNANATYTGKYNQSFGFDGNGDYVSIAAGTMNNRVNWTYSFWFKPVESANMGLMGPISADGAAYDREVYMNSSRNILAYCWPGSVVTVGHNSVLSLNQWTHVSVVKNSSSITIYVNGVGQSGNCGDCYVGYDSSALFNVGYAKSSGTNGLPVAGTALYTSGSIDEVIIFNRSLTSAEILSLYNASANKYYNNFTSLSLGQHNFTAYAVDTAGNKNQTSRTVNITTATPDTIYPTYSAYWNTTGTYPSQLAYFNVTIANTNGTVILYYPGGSVQASNITNVFNATINFTTAGTRNYNWTAWGNGTSMNKNWSNNLNYTVNVADATSPLITILSPGNSTYNVLQITFNISSNENLSACIFSFSNFAINYTLSVNSSLTGANYTNSSIGDGSYTAKFYCNDTAGNVNNTEKIDFSVLLPKIGVSFVYPTANINVSQNQFFNVTVNVSCTGANCGEINVSLDPETYDKLWNVTFNPSSYDSAYSIAEDSSGNVYVTGSDGGYHEFVAKYDSGGNYLFNVSESKGVYTYGYGVATDSGGNFYTVGYFYDPSWNTYSYLTKRDSSGNKEWNITSPMAYIFYNTKTDSSGNVYVVGNNPSSYGYMAKYNSSGYQLWNITDIGSYGFYGVTTDSSGNVYATGNSLDSHYYMAKYNSSGNQVWNVNDSTYTNYMYAKDIGVDSSGNIYVIGSAYTDDWYMQCYAAKYNSSGNKQWGRNVSDYTYSCGDGMYGYAGIAVDSSSNSYIAGGYYNSYDSTYGYLIIKYDLNGNIAWNTTETTYPTYSIATDIDLDETESDIYMTGYVNHGGDYDFYTVAYHGENSGITAKGLINTTIGASPFYTNESNPRNISLNAGQSELVVFWVNATGNVGSNYSFFAYANLTSDFTIGNITNKLNVSIIEAAAVADTIYPTFSNYWNTTGTYPSQLAYFNVTIANTNGTVILYYDGGSVQASNITNVFNATVNFTTVGTRNYNWTGWGNGTSNNKNWSNNLNYTVDSADATSPNIFIVSPANNSNSSDTGLDVTYNVSDLGLQSCWYTKNAGASNSSLTCGTNITSETWGENVNNITIYANDTSGNTNSSSVRFSIDTTAPRVYLLNPGNATSGYNSTVFFGANFTDLRLANVTLYLWNNTALVNTTSATASGSAYVSNISVVLPNEGVFYWNYRGCDSLNNCVFNITNWTYTYTAPSYSVYMSPKLSQQINWTLSSLPAENQSADGNNASGITQYYINISADGATVDLYVKASGDLMTGDLDVLGLGNETYSLNTTDNLVPSASKYQLTTTYSDNKIGDDLANGSVVFLKFFLNAPIAQAAGTYNNTLLFKAVLHGATP